MNESELEQSLRQLRPAEPSAALEERIAVAMKARSFDTSRLPAAGLVRRRGTWPTWLNSLGWASLGATAGVAAAVLLSPPRLAEPKSASVIPPSSVLSPAAVTAPEPASPSLFERAESAQEVVSSEEAGTLYDADDQPSRLVRYTSIEKHVWLNPSTGAEVQVEMPREDMVLIPVSYQ